MKKMMKFVGKALLWVVGIVVALVLALPLWIGAVVKPVANSVVPSKTGTGFNLGEFGLNPYSGRLTVGDVQLENPEGCSQKMAATLGKLYVDVDMGTVASDMIVIEDITIKDVFVSYVSNGKGENNFAIIKRNATGGKAEAKPAQDKAPAAKPAEKKPADGKPAKKVVIDHLVVENVMVQLGPLPVSLKKKIELNGIGRKSNGATLEEAWDQVYAAVMKAISDLGVNVNDLVNKLGNVGMDQAMKALEAAKAANVKGMQDALKNGAGLVNGAAGKTAEAVGASAGKAVSAVNESASKTVGAVSEKTSKAVGSVNESAGKAVDAVGASAGKAVDAVSEGAGKAVDTFKGLFK